MSYCNTVESISIGTPSVWHSLVQPACIYICIVKYINPLQKMLHVFRIESVHYVFPVSSAPLSPSILFSLISQFTTVASRYSQDVRRINHCRLPSVSPSPHHCFRHTRKSGSQYCRLHIFLSNRSSYSGARRVINSYFHETRDM